MVAYIVQEAKKDEMGEYDPEEVPVSYTHLDVYKRQPQNNAFAGTGSPTTELVCRVSLLNLAKRSAENTEIKNAA